ncbi:epigen [Callorhinchus milii]|nr:epigen [Callorhinchus milii]|eukprot:gi/632949449/ref/XP_007890163.1/ PREDICTED: epigen [Callorhinchus milii]
MEYSAGKYIVIINAIIAMTNAGNILSKTAAPGLLSASDVLQNELESAAQNKPAQKEAQELPAVLLVQKPCHKDDKSYCMNGICTYQDDQDQSMKHRMCVCHAGYTGDRCQHMTLTSHTTEDSERYIAIVIGSGFLLIALAGVLFYFIHYRCQKSNATYNKCLREAQV